jgi:hypothetical protein
MRKSDQDLFASCFLLPTKATEKGVVLCFANMQENLGRLMLA